MSYPFNRGNFSHCGDEEGLGWGCLLALFKSHHEAPSNSSDISGEFCVEMFTSKTFTIPKGQFSG